MFCVVQKVPKTFEGMESTRSQGKVHGVCMLLKNMANLVDDKWLWNLGLSSCPAPQKVHRGPWWSDGSLKIRIYSLRSESAVLWLTLFAAWSKVCLILHVLVSKVWSVHVPYEVLWEFIGRKNLFRLATITNFSCLVRTRTD